MKENNFESINEVRKRIDFNYYFIKEIEKLINEVSDEKLQLDLVSLVGYLYAFFVTGVYANSELEERLIRLSNKLSNKSECVLSHGANPKKALIVMTLSAIGGGHSVLANNWICWDEDFEYSVVFTTQRKEEVVDFISESVKESGGEIYTLDGDYLEKAITLRKLSNSYAKIVLFTHMEDIVPILAYGVEGWNIPIYFYNHADFRFSFGMSIADKVMNLQPFDQEKTVRYRGVPEKKSCVVKFPNGGELCSILNKKYKENDDTIPLQSLSKKYNFALGDKLIVSIGDEFKYRDIIGYSFTEYVERVLDEYSGDVRFIVVGPDNTSEKWAGLEQKTGGKAKAIGYIERKDMDSLIRQADLFVLSFPMLASGTAIAERAMVPCLALFIVKRGGYFFGENAAFSVDELVKKSIDVLNGEREKYQGHMLEMYDSKDAWQKTLRQIESTVQTHETTSLHPERHIEEQELVNCQIMQDLGRQNAEKYLEEHSFNAYIWMKLMELDRKYDMGIIPDRRILLCDEKKYLNYQKCEQLYRKCDMLYIYSAKWINLALSNITISNYLLRRGYKKIAIYGFGKLGKLLLKEMGESSLEVVYVIDKMVESTTSNLVLSKPQDVHKPVDVVVNTTAFDNYAISKELSDQYQMISLFDIIDILTEAE